MSSVIERSSSKTPSAIPTLLRIIAWIAGTEPCDQFVHLRLLCLPGTYLSREATDQWLGGDMSMPLTRGDAYAYGSACTYARRYSLAALIGICPYDDDGNEASGMVACQPTSKPTSPASSDRGSGPAITYRTLRQRSVPSPTPADVRASYEARETEDIPADPQGLLELRKLASTAAVEEAALCQHYRVKALHELSPRDAARARRALERKVQALRPAAKEAWHCSSKSVKRT